MQIISSLPGILIVDRLHLEPSVNLSEDRSKTFDYWIALGNTWIDF